MFSSVLETRSDHELRIVSVEKKAVLQAWKETDQFVRLHSAMNLEDVRSEVWSKLDHPVLELKNLMAPRRARESGRGRQTRRHS